MKVYIGIDCHARSVRLCAVDSSGAVLAERTIPSNREALFAFVRRFGSDVQVAVEAMGTHYWLVDALDQAGIDVVLAHPLMLKAISYAKVKTDKADAQTIAKLLRLGMLPEAYLYPRALRPLRDLSRRRQALVAYRAVHYRHIQRLHHQTALDAPSRNAVKTLGRAELVARFDDEATKLFAGSLVDITGCLTTEIDRMEKFMHAQCREKTGYARVMAIPGIGKTYGQIILLESEGIFRFPSHREYVSYARLVPGADNSGGKVRNGHNPNQGNAKLKNAFRQAALHAVMFDRTIKRFFDRKLRVVNRKTVAYSIVARKLAVGVYHILRNGADFDVERLFGPKVVEKEATIATRE